MPEPSPSQHARIWGGVHRHLDRALDLLDDKEDLPETSWFGSSKQTQQKEIERILDAAIAVLETSDALGARLRIRTLRDEIQQSLHRQAEYQRRMVSAPQRKSLRLHEKLFSETREGCEEKISNETQRMDQLRGDIDGATEAFRKALLQIGIDRSVVDIDMLANPVTRDDVVSMASVYANLAAVAAELERQVQLSRESPSEARRYYGMYVVLLHCLDRIYGRFLSEIATDQIPKLGRFSQEASVNIADAKEQIRNGGPVPSLRANIEAGQTTIRACEMYIRRLESQQELISQEHARVIVALNAARNTYRTVRLSLDVADMIRNGEAVCAYVKTLRPPEMRVYENAELKKELGRLTERLLEK